MKLKTKKFIAREGLILLLGYFFCGIAQGYLPLATVNFIKIIPLAGILYALYWGIRFIIWAVKILNQKEERN